MATPLTQGYQRDLIIKKESALGTAPGATSARVLRRTTGTFMLRRERVASAEKDASFQVKDSRHGTERVDGNLQQELYNGGSTELIEQLLMRDFAAVSAIAAGSGNGFAASGGVVSRTSGSMITAGLRKGMVVRLTGMGTNAANRNWLITAIASDGLSVTLAPVDGGAALADFTDDETGSIVIPGKRTYIPATGQSLQSLAIEDRIRDFDTSKLNLGLRASALAMTMGINAMVNMAWTLIGLEQQELDNAASPYFTSPTASGFGRAFSSAKGLIMIDGAVQAIVTGLTLNLANGAAVFPVAFSQRSPDIPLGRALTVTGQMTAGTKDRAFNTLFRNETEFPVTFVFEAPAVSGAPEFMAFHLPRVKVNSQDEDDPDGPIIQTIDIEALLADASAGVDSTTIAVQDSSLS